MTRRAFVLTFCFAALMLLGAGLFSQVAMAASYSSIPSADTSADGNSPDSPQGNSAVLSMGWASASDPNWWTHALLYTLPGDLAGATINSASLTVPLRYATNADPQTVGLQAFTKAWDEATQTYRIAAGPADFWTGASAALPLGGLGGVQDRVLDGGSNENYDTQVIPNVLYLSESASNHTAVWDAKTLVEYWAGGGANLGAALEYLTNEPVGATLITHWSREHTPPGGSAGDLAAVLAIDYTPIPEPTSMVLMGIGCLSLVLRRRRG